MNRFASVTGDSAGQSGQSLKQFKDLFISLGRELPVSTADVQQAAIEMAKGGIEPATIAAGGLRDVLDLAAAGEVGIAEAAEIASKQLGVWVDSAASADHQGRIPQRLGQLAQPGRERLTVDVDDLALGLANSGKSADIAGLSFRETVTSMALISRASPAPPTPAPASKPS
jgi:TP901 family phage tail tape measure protein